MPERAIAATDTPPEPAPRASAAGVACALGGFLLIGVALAPALVGRTAFLPADYWMATVPFALAAPRAVHDFPSNALLGDPALLYPPQLWVLREALHNGAFPLWNRFARGGESMLATGQSGPFAPTTWPILALPWPLGFAWAAALRFGLLWLGAYLYGRAMKLERAWSVAIALGFCAAPLFAVHFQQLPRATAHLALPWLLLGVERLAAAMPRGARVMTRAALPLAACHCYALLAGYPPAALTVSFGASAYLALRLPWHPRGAALAARAIGFAALALGAALAAPVLVPFAEALRDSATLADRGEGGQWTLATAALRLLWNPYTFGSPIRGAAHAWNGPENFEEAQQYIGLVPWVFLLGCAPLLMRLRGDDRLRALALAAIAAIAASLGFGWWPLHPLLTELPPFSVNANPRLLFLAQVAIPALAALAARTWLAARIVSAARARGFAPLAAAATTGAALLVSLALAERWEPRAWIALASAAALVAAGFCAATPLQRRVATALVPLLWLADVAPVYRGIHPQVPVGWADPARAVAMLPDAIRADPHARVAFERVTPPNLPAVFGVEDVRAYSFPVPSRYDRYALEVMEIPIPSNLLREDLARAATLAGLEQTCAQWLWTTQRYDGTPLAARVAKIWERNDRLFVYRLTQASPCAAWYADDAVTHVGDLDAAVAALHASLGKPAETIVIESPGTSRVAPAQPDVGVAVQAQWPNPNRIDVEIPVAARDRDGWLVLRVSHDLGWSAVSQHRAALRVVPAQVRFLAVWVPTGTEHVTLRYAPVHFGATLGIAGVALALLGLSQLWARGFPASAA
jgi:hypothetical protein